MCRILRLFRSSRHDIRASDFERRFGWFIERRGECIGELEYARWDANSQFWHEYRVSWRRPEGDAARIIDWAESGIELRNRKFSDVVVRKFFSASSSTEEIVSIRGAFVPVERFQKLTEKPKSRERQRRTNH